MALTININGLTLCHKESGGSATATVPDVCKTPSPGGPIPIPYPNIAFSNDLAKGTKTIFVDGGNMAAHKASELSVSTGDEPGTLGGVKSATNRKEATWLTFSFDVKLEGEHACRLTDKLLMNHGNTACLGGWLQDWLNGPKGPAECAELLARIIVIIGEGMVGKTDGIRGLEERMAQQITGAGAPTAPMDRPPTPEFPSGSNSWMRHDSEIARQQQSLERHLDAYDDHCGGQPPPPANARSWVTEPRPQPSEYVGPAPAVPPAERAPESSLGDDLLTAGKWVVGGVVVIVAVGGIVALVADDATGVGVADDAAIPVLGGLAAWGMGLMGVVP